MKNVRPVLDPAACVACGKCVRVCVSMCLEKVDGRPRIERPDWCSGCLHCVAVCAVNAISVPPFTLPEAPRPGNGPAVDPDTLLLLLRERRSVRRYRDEPVPREVLERLVQAGRYAPTGTNAQNVGWVVFGSRESVAGVREKVLPFYERLFKAVRNPLGRLAVRAMAGGEAVQTLVDYLPVAEEADRRLPLGDDRLTHNAPALLLVHGPAGDTCTPFNGAVALYHASLLAHTLGLGCCFNGFVENAVNRDRAVAAHVGLPAGHRCSGAMTLGWAEPSLRYRRLAERLDPTVQWR